MAQAFPNITPTGRSYSPGSYPETDFLALNGARSIVRFGAEQFGHRLELTFRNISDDQALQIVQHYTAVMSNYDNATFSIATSGSPMAGVGSSGLRQEMSQQGTATKWRYSDPPTVQSVYPGVSNVSCRFTGYLDGANDITS